jgi:hypothetical protein
MKIPLTALVLAGFEILVLEQADARAGGKATPISPPYVSIAEGACKTWAPKARLASERQSDCRTLPHEVSGRRRLKR